MPYFDHAATTPINPVVLEAMVSTMGDVYGNPSSIHQFGRKAHEKLEEARQLIASTLQVRANEIVFTSGGTEGDNMAIIGTAKARQSEGKHIITTNVEHPAVLASMAYLENEGFEVTYLPVDSNGQISVAQVEAALRTDTILVSIMYANNETGVLFPIAEIGTLLATHSAAFHTDAVQVFGKITLEPKALGIDLLSISAHKINGPKGVGFLYQRGGVKLSPLLHGGEQEEKRRAGTENLAGIVGLSVAVQQLSEEQRRVNWEKYQGFNQLLFERLKDAGVMFEVNGGKAEKIPHIINLQLKDIASNLLLMHLDLQGIAISTGSACSAGNVEPSHVLEAMHGKDNPSIHQSVRISFGLGNTQAEVENLADQLAALTHRLKK